MGEGNVEFLTDRQNFIKIGFKHNSFEFPPSPTPHIWNFIPPLRIVITMLEQLISQWGIFGLLPASFIGSTIFIPFAIEFFFPALLASGVDPYLIVITAGIGSTIGTFVNYWLGHVGSRYIKKRVDSQRMEKAKKMMDRYGWFGLLLIITIPLPLPVDGVTIIPGITRMNFLWFSLIIFFGKTLKYAFFVGLLNGLLLLI